jgi:hypothetical protein
LLLGLYALPLFDIVEELILVGEEIGNARVLLDL